MTETTVVEVFGYLFGAYGIGWVMGFLVLIFKKASEQL